MTLYGRSGISIAQNRRGSKCCEEFEGRQSRLYRQESEKKQDYRQGIERKKQYRQGESRADRLASGGVSRRFRLKTLSR